MATQGACRYEAASFRDMYANPNSVKPVTPYDR